MHNSRRECLGSTGRICCKLLRALSNNAKNEKRMNKDPAACSIHFGHDFWQRHKAVSDEQDKQTDRSNKKISPQDGLFKSYPPPLQLTL